MVNLAPWWLRLSLNGCVMSSTRGRCGLTGRSALKWPYCLGMNAEPPPYDCIDPVTITPDRYGGTYSGGCWLAFPLDPSAVPGDPSGDDLAAVSWWSELGDLPVGRGDTPDQAYADLARRLEAIEPARRYPAASERSGDMWTWELRWPNGEVTIIDRCWRGENRGPRRQQLIPRPPPQCRHRGRSEHLTLRPPRRVRSRQQARP